MINLLYCGNNRVFDGMLISILSITKHTKKPIHTFLLTMDLQEVDENHRPISRRQASYIESVLKKTNPESRVTLIDITDLFNAEMDSCANIESFYTPYCLLRLFCDKVDELPEKLLYLDTDIVAMDDIEPLYNTDINGFEFAAVTDYLGKIFQIYKSFRYFNSGVMLMNLPEIRKTGLFEKARRACKTRKMDFPDQDALNYYAKKKKYLPSKYNDQRRLHKNTVLRHFCKSVRWLPFFHTVNVKPWQEKELHEIVKVYYIDDIIEEYKKCIEEFKKGKEV